MKKILPLFLLFLMHNFLHAEFPKKPMPNTDDWLKDQRDQTDTLAIPLDNSEAEEEQEEKDLQRRQRSLPRTK